MHILCSDLYSSLDSWKNCKFLVNLAVLADVLQAGWCLAGAAAVRLAWRSIFSSTCPSCSLWRCYLWLSWKSSSTGSPSVPCSCCKGPRPLVPLFIKWSDRLWRELILRRTADSCCPSRSSCSPSPPPSPWISQRWQRAGANRGLTTA